MTIPFLLGLAGAAPASAQGLVEYALVLVLVAGPETVIDDFQVPTALEEDCAIDPAASPLCDVLDEIVDMSAAEAMAVLHDAGGVIEYTESIDAVGATRLASDDCADADSGSTGLWPGTYTVTESWPTTWDGRSSTRSIDSAWTSRTTTRSKTDVPLEEVSMSYQKIDWTYSRASHTSAAAEEFVYTISDGNGGQTSASSTSCIDQIQSRLGDTGELSSVAEITGRSSTPPADGEGVVFVYTVSND